MMRGRSGWHTLSRRRYMKMFSRHLPMWKATRDFVSANNVKSVVEVGCGPALLADDVDSYIGIDTNRLILHSNASLYGSHARWISQDWQAVYAPALHAEMFLGAGVIEHCEGYEPFLDHVLEMPRLKYAVVTFHKGLSNRKKQIKRNWGGRKARDGDIFWDNLYKQRDIWKWLLANVEGADCHIFTLQHASGRWRRWDSVLVLDWTCRAKLDMWERRGIRGHQAGKLNQHHYVCPQSG